MISRVAAVKLATEPASDKSPKKSPVPFATKSPITVIVAPAAVVRRVRLFEPLSEEMSPAVVSELRVMPPIAVAVRVTSL